MEQKKSIVTSVTPNGSWEGKFGTMYKFEVSFENGDVGEYSSKSEEQTKFVVGSEVEYEFTDGKYPKVKPHYINPMPKTTYSNSGNDRERMIVKQSTLKVSVELHIALGDLDRSNIKDTAQYFTDWVMDNQEEKKESNLPF